MSLHFYLFDVNHGQSAAVFLPNNRWCIFDAGCSSELSPTLYIKGLEERRNSTLLPIPFRNFEPFTFLKATISHLHGDHLSDYQNMFLALPGFFRTVVYDTEYLTDVYSSSARESWDTISGFCRDHSNQYGTTVAIPDFGNVTVIERWLPVSVARALGGSANSRVNNASIITRISCYGNSILLCGDIETEAWEFVLKTAVDKEVWRSLVSNIGVLVTPHHGHSAGYSVEMMNLAKPSVVLVSVESKDEHVDSRYSSEAVKGITVNGRPYKSITTRMKGTIHLEIKPSVFPGLIGLRTWHGL